MSAELWIYLQDLRESLLCHHFATITRQPIKLESCSNTRCSKSSSLKFLKYWKVLDLGFFVGDITSGVGLNLFGSCCMALGANAKSQFFDSSFYWKLSYKTSL